MTKENNIVPVFRVTLNGGMSWRSDRYSYVGDFFSDAWGINGALKQISLDNGESFLSMDELKEAIDNYGEMKKMDGGFSV